MNKGRGKKTAFHLFPANEAKILLIFLWPKSDSFCLLRYLAILKKLDEHGLPEVCMLVAAAFDFCLWGEKGRATLGLTRPLFAAKLLLQRRGLNPVF